MSGPPDGLTFMGGFNGPCPNMGAENWKLLKTIIVGVLWVCLGLLSIRILCFFLIG